MRIKKSLVLVLVSTILALPLAEFAVRVASARWLLVFDVEMWRYAREIKTESSVPGMVEEHQPDKESKLMGVRIRTDAHGFRLPDSDTAERRKSNNRIVVALGDSLTLGWGVPEGNTYSDLLEKALNERAGQSNARLFTVFNAGIGNSNTSMEVERYQQDIRRLKPEWLILGFFINDAEPDPVANNSIVVKYSALAALISTQRSIRTGARYENYQTYYRGLYDDDRPGYQRMKQRLGELGRLLREDKVGATMVLLPEMHEPRGFGPFADVYEKVAALARENGFEVIDASKDFLAGPGNDYWVARDDAHPNAAAQILFATALTKSKYFPVSPPKE